ncbi:uncharacterized protein LOC142569087 isoform X2 [Dermacentor variabilis]|uniref:uncharacterized protein LOC142569087 isoform X2 n=1 Tax=Dermacentor variabilis TaxID=34621 RepID=UPI003F5CA2C9
MRTVVALWTILVLGELGTPAPSQEALSCNKTETMAFTELLPPLKLSSRNGTQVTATQRLFPWLHSAFGAILTSREIPRAIKEEGRMKPDLERDLSSRLLACVRCTSCPAVPAGGAVAGAGYLRRVCPVTHRGCSALWTGGTPKALQGEARRKRNHFHQSPRLCWQDNILYLDTASMPYDLALIAGTNMEFSKALERRIEGFLEMTS